MVKNEARVTVLGVPDHPGAAITLFSKIAAKKIGMDMIVQNVAAEGHTDISFTVLEEELASTLKSVEEGVAEVGAAGFDYEDEVSKISVVGLGMKDQSGVAEKMFRVLAEKGINILMITTSEIKISVLVERHDALDALRAVHAEFGLDREPPGAEESREEPADPVAPANTVDLIARLQGLEDLIIERISLDDSQARVTLVAVPDTPGLAAQVFAEIADAGILVDMIVQSMGRAGHANLSFTVPRTDLERSLKLATELAEGFGSPRPTHSPQVAKLSVTGTGMRSHTSVATRMLKSLADARINVEMISTGEVRLNVVVDGPHGQKGLEAIKKEFADVTM